MAFPVVEGVAESSVNTAGTSHAVTLPASITATDLVLIVMDIGSTSATLNALTDWTEVLDEASANGLKIIRYTGAGVPGNPTFTSSASTRSASIAYRISGASESVAPQIGTTATGTSATPDPPSVTPAGGISRDYLFVAFYGAAGEEADDDTWSNTPPTNYTPSPPRQKSCGTAGTNLGGLIAAAERSLTTGSAEDPGTFAKDVSAAWRSQTIIVHPISQGASTGAVDWAGSATGVSAFRGAGSGSIAWAGSATGTIVKFGSATGAVSWAGAATGVSVHIGTGAGSITWAGTSNGQTALKGAGVGSVTWAGTATGITSRAGNATGSITWAGTADGTTDREGSSTGAITWAGTATGTADREGSSTGSITWAGSADGEMPAVGPQEGAATGAITWTGTATGTTEREGVVSGTITWDGLATGAAAHEGTGAGTFTWTGTATGEVPVETFWSPDPVAYATAAVAYSPAPVAYTPVGPDDPPQ